jgi:hypothetical protein
LSTTINTPDRRETTFAYGRPLLQLAREIGRHLATMHRWRTVGVLDAGGYRRRLAMTRVGGRWFVRDEDLASFFAALATREEDSPRSPAVKSREASKVSAELDRIGI